VSPPILLVVAFKLPEKLSARIPGIGEASLLPGKYYLLKHYRYSLASVEKRSLELENGTKEMGTFLDFCLLQGEERKIRTRESADDWEAFLAKVFAGEGVVVFEKKSKPPEILVFDPLEKINLRRLLQLNQEQSQELE